MTTVTIILISEEHRHNVWSLRLRGDGALAEYARNHIEAYQPVASWTCSERDSAAAEEAFEITNNPSRQSEREILYGKQRSVSVGDIVEVSEGSNGKRYICDAVGWTKL